MVTQPFRATGASGASQQIETISGVGIDAKWPTTIEDARIAIGRIGQDIRDPQYMDQFGVGVSTFNNQIVVTCAGEESVRFDFVGEHSIANTFSIAMNYLSNSLASKNPDNRARLDRILERRLGVRDWSKPAAADNQPAGMR